MLSFYDFNGLDEIGKAEAVFKLGVFVDDRVDAVLKVQLYRLGNFYVEVFYDPTSNEIARYHAFKSLAQLAPYLRR